MAKMPPRNVNPALNSVCEGSAGIPELTKKARTKNIGAGPCIPSALKINIAVAPISPRTAAIPQTVPDKSVPNPNEKAIPRETKSSFKARFLYDSPPAYK